MVATVKNCSIAILKKLIKHWPGYTIFGSKPNDKGVKIKRESDRKIVCRFPSNYAAYVTMIDALRKKTNWAPEKPHGLGLKIPAVNYLTQTKAQHNASIHLCNIAQQASDKRDAVDALFRDIGIDPFDPRWKTKLNKILKVRRVHK